jgi:hypothetical protein
MDRIMRKGSNVIEIRAYAPGDGDLSFVARYTEDTPDGMRTEAVSPSPSYEECQQACPNGWVLYADGPHWRAHKATGGKE